MAGFDRSSASRRLAKGPAGIGGSALSTVRTIHDPVRSWPPVLPNRVHRVRLCGPCRCRKHGRRVGVRLALDDRPSIDLGPVGEHPGEDDAGVRHIVMIERKKRRGKKKDPGSRASAGWVMSACRARPCSYNQSGRLRPCSPCARAPLRF